MSDLTGLSLGEKKIVKDAVAKSIDPLVTKFKAVGLTLDVDIAAITKLMTEVSFDKSKSYILLGTSIPQIGEGILKWMENPDFKEALVDAAPKLIFSAKKYSDGRADVVLANKVVTVFISHDYLQSQFDASDVTYSVTSKLEKLL
jgi:hypothetical protein